MQTLLFVMKAFNRYKPHYADNLKLALPVVISQLGYTLVQTADIIVVGHFAGTVSLAAVSLASSIFVVPLLIGVGISYGLTPLIAQNNGRNDDVECGQLLSNSLFINLVTGILLFGIIAFGAIYFLPVLHQTPEVARLAKPFFSAFSAVGYTGFVV